MGLFVHCSGLACTGPIPKLLNVSGLNGPLHLLRGSQMGAENPVPNPSLWTAACYSVYRLIVFFPLFPSHIWSCRAAHQSCQMCSCFTKALRSPESHNHQTPPLRATSELLLPLQGLL